MWNIGAEGQYIIGALCAAGVGIAGGPAGGGLIIAADDRWPAIVGGVAWAAMPALLRTRFTVNEILSSLMLTYVALQVLGYLVGGPWKDPNGRNFPRPRPCAESRACRSWSRARPCIWALPIAVILPFVFWLLMARSVFGFQIRVVGSGAACGAPWRV